MKSNVQVVLEYQLRKFKFRLNCRRIPGPLNKDRYSFLIISHSILLTMINFSVRNCRKNQNTFCNFFYVLKSCRLWVNVDNIVEPGRPQITLHAVYLRLQRHTQNVQYLLLFQQWLHKHTAVLRYIYAACLVSSATSKSYFCTNFNAI
jgi:hypothetical protein